MPNPFHTMISIKTKKHYTERDSKIGFGLCQSRFSSHVRYTSHSPLNAEIISKILWRGETNQLVNRDGLFDIVLKRQATIANLTGRKKNEMEETVGKMQKVFHEAFGFGDFVRWMPFKMDSTTLSRAFRGSFHTSRHVNFSTKRGILGIL